MSNRRQRTEKRRWGFAGLAAVLLAGWGSTAGRAQTQQSPVQVRDVPFQAMQVVTRTSQAGTTVTRGRMARDAAGSTYVELVDPQTGTATTAFVLDVPGRRGIVLDLVHRRYSVRPAPELAARELPAASVPEQLHWAAETRGKTEHALRNQTETTVTHLGTKLVSGLLAIGSREVWPERPVAEMAARRREMESWFSVDLGLCIQMTETDAAVHERTEVGLTEILRVEPDRGLFRVPEGYLPDGAAAELPAGPTRDGQ